MKEWIKHSHKYKRWLMNNLYSFSEFIKSLFFIFLWILLNFLLNLFFFIFFIFWILFFSFQECKHQFENRRWNCLTVEDDTVFGPISSIGKLLFCYTYKVFLLWRQGFEQFYSMFSNKNVRDESINSSSPLNIFLEISSQKPFLYYFYDKKVIFHFIIL